MLQEVIQLNESTAKPLKFEAAARLAREILGVIALKSNIHEFAVARLNSALKVRSPTVGSMARYELAILAVEQGFESSP